MSILARLCSVAVPAEAVTFDHAYAFLVERGNDLGLSASWFMSITVSFHVSFHGEFLIEGHEALHGHGEASVFVQESLPVGRVSHRAVVLGARSLHQALRQHRRSCARIRRSPSG